MTALVGRAYSRAAEEAKKETQALRNTILEFMSSFFGPPRSSWPRLVRSLAPPERRRFRENNFRRVEYGGREVTAAVSAG